MVERKLD